MLCGRRRQRQRRFGCLATSAWKDQSTAAPRRRRRCRCRRCEQREQPSQRSPDATEVSRRDRGAAQGRDPGLSDVLVVPGKVVGFDREIAQIAGALAAAHGGLGRLLLQLRRRRSPPRRRGHQQHRWRQQQQRALQLDLALRRSMGRPAGPGPAQRHRNGLHGSPVERKQPGPSHLRGVLGRPETQRAHGSDISGRLQRRHVGRRRRTSAGAHR
mmetsp:Transcript_5221/g.10968  ORF Transcript_5221/g.10968 Transcript_5221/m.10968 type:complete len:214 (-) Transcript_5221:1309-1950(-)